MGTMNFQLFRLTNALAAFTSLMNGIFKTILDSFFIVIIDDILVYFKNVEEHANNLRTVVGYPWKINIIC